jgi:hypothetical protein
VTAPSTPIGGALRPPSPQTSTKKTRAEKREERSERNKREAFQAAAERGARYARIEYEREALDQPFTEDGRKAEEKAYERLCRSYRELERRYEVRLPRPQRRRVRVIR